ncbi:MAG: copper ion binding protein [Clostridiales bacterium]|jgi:copper chaperone|nr:copper ion binding protein [Clostridiales bacterium]
MEKAVVKVEGMSCEHCEKAVQEAVKKLPGIKKVKASTGKKQAVVEFDQTLVTLAKIVEAITESGYEATA